MRGPCGPRRLSLRSTTVVFVGGALCGGLKTLNGSADELPLPLLAVRMLRGV